MNQQTPEEVISSLEQMIEIEQQVLLCALKDCLEMYDVEDSILQRTIIQRVQANAITLVNLGYAVAQLNALVNKEIAETEAMLEQENE